MSKSTKAAKKQQAVEETPVVDSETTNVDETTEVTETTEATAEPTTMETETTEATTEGAAVEQKEGEAKKPKKSTHDVKDFGTPLKKLLSKREKSASCAAPARNLASAVIVALVDDISEICSLLVRRRKQSVCTTDDAKDAITLRFYNTPDLKQHMVHAGATALSTFEANKGKKSETGGPLKTHIKSGLLLPVSKIYKLVKAKTQLMLRSGVDVVIAGALEYLIAELMGGAWEVCCEAKLKTIKPLHITRALTQDQELHMNLSKYVLGQGTGHSVDPGFVPAIELDEYKKAEMKKKQGIIDEIPKELVEKHKKKEAAKKEAAKKRKAESGETTTATATKGKRKAADAVEGEPAAKKQKTAKAQ